MHKVYLVEPKYSYDGKGWQLRIAQYKQMKSLIISFGKITTMLQTLGGIITLVSVIALSIFTPMKWVLSSMEFIIQECVKWVSFQNSI